MINRKKRIGVKCNDINGYIMVLDILNKFSNLQIGDYVQEVESCVVMDVNELKKLVRKFSYKRTIKLKIFRDNQVYLIEETLLDIPFDEERGYDTIYGEIKYNGELFRTIYTQKKDNPPPSKIILLLQGIDCSSIDYALDKDNILRKLIYNLTNEVFVTARIELYGNGDSAGDDISKYTFEEIVKLYEEMAKQCYMQGYEVYLWGYSIGGIIAPIIAGRLPNIVKGIVIFDTIFPDLFTYLIKNQIRQQRIKGKSKDEIKQSICEYELLLVQLLQNGLEPQKIVEKNPALNMYFSGRNDFMGHTYKYAQQIFQIDLEDCLKKCVVPILMIVGENDYVIDYNDHVDMYTKLKVTNKITFLSLPVNHWFEIKGSISENIFEIIDSAMKKIFIEER